MCLRDFRDVEKALWEHHLWLVTWKKARKSAPGFRSSSCEVRTEFDFEWLSGFCKDPDTESVYLQRTFDVEGRKHAICLEVRVTTAQIFDCAEDLSMRHMKEYRRLFCR